MKNILIIILFSLSPLESLHASSILDFIELNCIINYFTSNKKKNKKQIELTKWVSANKDDKYVNEINLSRNFNKKYGNIKNQKQFLKFLMRYDQEYPLNIFVSREFDNKNIDAIYSYIMFEIYSEIEGDFACVEKIPKATEMLLTNRIQIPENIDAIYGNNMAVHLLNSAVNQAANFISLCYQDANQTLNNIIEDHEEIKAKAHKINHDHSVVRLAYIKYLFEKSLLINDCERQLEFLAQILLNAYIFEAKISIDEILPIVICTLKNFDLDEFKASSFYKNLKLTSEFSDIDTRSYMATIIISSVVFIENENQK